MKVNILFLALAVFTLSACGNDDDAEPTPVTIYEENGLIYYDEGNVTGPQLAAGTYETAIRINSQVMGKHTDKSVKNVQWFMGFKPANCTVKIYGEGSATQPGSVLYSADVTADLQEISWQTHTIPDNLAIDGKDIWVSIAITHDIDMQSIGCDSGPRRDNGDFIYDASNQTWETYEQRTGSESINWNIRLQVE